MFASCSNCLVTHASNRRTEGTEPDLQITNDGRGSPGARVLQVPLISSWLRKGAPLAVARRHLKLQRNHLSSHSRVSSLTFFFLLERFQRDFVARCSETLDEGTPIRLFVDMGDSRFLF